MTVNPYEPPESASDLSAQEAVFIDTSQVDYSGGNKTVLKVASGGALLTAVGLAVATPIFANSFGVVGAFGIPAVIWLLSLGGISAVLRNSGVSQLRRIIVASALAIPAYVLFVPVCTGLTAVTMTALEPSGADSGFAMVFGFGGATFVSFVGIFALFAIALRGFYRRRMRGRMRQQGFSEGDGSEATHE